MNVLVSALVALVVSAGAFLGIQHENQSLSPVMQNAISAYVKQSEQSPSFGSTLPIAGQTYNLAGSGVSAAATSITLASFKVTQTGQPILDPDLGTTFYITLEPGNPLKQEIVSCTTDVQNANGTATFSGCSRGLSPIQPFTASTTLQFSHGGGTQVIFSNPPQFYNQFALLSNTNSFTGSNTFATSPILTAQCNGSSSNNALCDKAYIDGVAVAGASNANETTKGISELATQIEMASSSIFGSTGASLVLQAKYSTSSPGTANLWDVITLNDGNISPLFLDGTLENYTWNATSTFNQGFVDTASTTIAASAAYPLTLNGVKVVAPASQGAIGTMLQNNGSGVLSWSTNFGLLVATSTTPVNIANSVATSTLLSTTVPANVLNGGLLTLTFHLPEFALVNTNVLETCIQYGSKASCFALTAAATFSASTGMLTVTIYTGPSSSSQNIVTTYVGNNVFNAIGGDATTFANTINNGSLSADSTQAQPLIVSIAFATGSVNNIFDMNDVNVLLAH